MRYLLLLSRLEFFLCVCLLSGCISGKWSAKKASFQHSYAKNVRPEFWLEYYPYPPTQPEHLLPRVRAIPSYDGWTDLRMQRDLKQISAAGFNAILLPVTPETLAGKTFAERLRRFHQLAAALPRPLSLALIVAPEAADFTLSLPNTLDFFLNHGLHNFSNSLKVKQRPILFFANHIHLFGEYDGPCAYAKINDFFPDVDELSVNKHCRILVSKKMPKSLEYNIKNLRGNGFFFAQQLQQAFQQQASIIYISSWNNYQDASFIEPNSLDQQQMLEILQKARQTLASGE